MIVVTAQSQRSLQVVLKFASAFGQNVELGVSISNYNGVKCRENISAWVLISCGIRFYFADRKGIQTLPTAYD